MDEKNNVLNSLKTGDDDVKNTLNNILSSYQEEPPKQNIPDAKEPKLIEVPKPSIKTEELEADLARYEERQKMSPLERMQEDKASGKLQSGIIVSNEDLEKGAENPNKVLGLYNDERLHDWDEAIDELDEQIEKRKHVTVVRTPKTKFEYMVMMDELNSVTKVNDEWIIDFKNKNGEPLQPHYLRIRKEGEPEFDFSPLKSFDSTEKADPNAPAEPTPYVHEDAETSDVKTLHAEVSDETKETIEVLIDKTGLGADFAFTDEEKQKLEAASLIRVKEVETQRINSLRAKKSVKSFSDFVAPYDLSGSSVTLCFPASGFKARMQGLTFGEYSDIALSLESINFDMYRKRLSVIYNKMKDISTGPFKDFEDFLHRFAYADINLALYGLFAASELEETTTSFRCQNPECGKTFDWKYQPRSLLRLDRCSKKFLDDMRKLATANAIDYDSIHENSAIMQSKFIELPDTKFIIEFGATSAYHLLYNFLPVLEEEKFVEAFPELKDDDIGIQTYVTNAALIPGIRSIMIPDPDSDEMIECTAYTDILHALYRVSPREMQLVQTYSMDVQNAYQSVFSFGDVRCPNCNNIIPNIDVEMAQLVFWTYQRLMNTEHTLEA